jgi:hypothetical protein
MLLEQLYLVLRKRKQLATLEAIAVTPAQEYRVNHTRYISAEQLIVYQLICH